MPIPVGSRKAIGDAFRRSKGTDPLWRGPIEDGITFSLLSRYLIDGERFRIFVIDGLGPVDRFNKSLGFGSMWHLCEESYSRGEDHLPSLQELVRKMGEQYPPDRVDIEMWYNVVRSVFPVYARYWEDHGDEVDRTPVAQEEKFRVRYELPSGREIVIRGMRDGIDRIRKTTYLKETKTKGRDIRPWEVENRLKFDLQTMIYLVTSILEYPELRIAGVRYNVVKRPLSGGKGDTKKWVKETYDQFYDRLGPHVMDKSELFFHRWKSKVSKADRDKFCRECLDPILENLLDDWEWWEFCLRGRESPYDYLLRSRKFPHHLSRHFRMPYGVWNPFVDGRGTTEYDEYLDTGNRGALIKIRTLFPELEED